MHVPTRSTSSTQASAQFSEEEMVDKLFEIGIDMEGFDLDGIDPIPLMPRREEARTRASLERLEANLGGC